MVEKIGPRRPRQRAYLREWRDFRELTGEQLAERMGTTKATISRYETGKRQYPGGFLAAVAEALNCQERDLYRLPTEQSIDAMIRNAPEPIKASIYAFVEKVLKSGT